MTLAIKVKPAYGHAGEPVRWVVVMGMTRISERFATKSEAEVEAIRERANRAEAKRQRERYQRRAGWQEYRALLLTHRDEIVASYSATHSVGAVFFELLGKMAAPDLTRFNLNQHHIYRFLKEEGVVMAGRADISAKAKARYTEALALRSTGLTYAAIGERMGISRERVRQLCLAGKE